jgi:mevalonate kinase
MSDHARVGRLFPGKVLLFGEHSIIDGSAALVVPLHRFSAGLTFTVSEADRNRAAQSNRYLRTFAAYLRANGFQIAHNHLEADLEQGLWLNSNIPVHYGTGSSGAAVASVFDAYRHNRNTPDEEIPALLQQDLAAMESFFHGTSSGIDPLCIFLDKPLVVEEGGKPEVWHGKQQSVAQMHAFLIDTGMPGETGRVVGRFREQLKDAAFNKAYRDTYIPQVNAVVRAYTSGNLTTGLLQALSELQLQFFREAIPDPFFSLWQKGLTNGRYTLKLCGSGGGGYLLMFCENMVEVRNELQPFNITEIEF